MKKIYLGFFLTITIFLNAQWAVQNSGFSNPGTGVACISIVNANHVWASALDTNGNQVQEFIRTIDGGNTWTSGVVSGINNQWNISTISAVNKDTAWVSCANWQNGGGRLYKTVNGGVNWTQQNFSAFSGSSGWANVVHFWNANDGVCMGDSNAGYWEIYTTGNGGTTWTRTPQANIPANLPGEYGVENLFSVSGDTIWYATSMSRVFRSTDKGLTWIASQTGLPGITSIAFKDGLNGLVEDGGILEVTTDGGVTWTSVSSLGTVHDGWMCYAKGTPGFYVTTETGAPDGGSSYSLDNGVTWVDIDFIDHGGVAFLNSQTGWSGGYNINSTSEGMFIWSGTVGIKTISANDDVKVTVYPNPFNTEATFTIKGKRLVNENVSVEIYDVVGNKIIVIPVISDNSFKLKKENMAEGMYFYKIMEGDKQLGTGRFIVN